MAKPPKVRKKPDWPAIAESGTPGLRAGRFRLGGTALGFCDDSARIESRTVCARPDKVIPSHGEPVGIADKPWRDGKGEAAALSS